jgi:DNA-binding protein HU-beta
MIRKDLVKYIAENANINQTDAELLLSIVLQGVSEALLKDGQLRLINFGSFEVKERAARKGINPKTGERIDIAASKGISFKASKELKTLICTPPKKKTPVSKKKTVK